MNKKYYIKNFLFGVVFFLICSYSLYFELNKKTSEHIVDYIILTINLFMFPYSKKLAEDFVLFFSKKEFWTTGIFMESLIKRRVEFFIYFIYFMFSIPIVALYFIYLLFKM